MTRRFLSVLLLVAFASTASSISAFALGEPVVDGPTSAAVDRNGSVAIAGVTVDAGDATSVQVSLAVTHGGVTLATTTGLTFAAGDGTLDPTLTFTGSGADVAAALATLTYVPDTDYVGGDAIDLQVTPGGSLYFAGNGHFYEFVTDLGISWTDAHDAAASRSLNGLTGYLATVTSDAENTFVHSKLEGQGWIGASDAAVEGEWRWVTGPEAGTQFWAGSYHGGFCPGPLASGAVGGAYNKWAGQEPNDAGCREDYAHFYLNGEWNDYPSNNGEAIQGYVVEYGGSVGDAPVIDTHEIVLSVLPTAPAAPTGVAATRGNGGASVSWTAPSDTGGTPVTDYTVTAQPGGATMTVSAPTTTAVFSDLTNGTEYTFTVVATNEVGDSPASAGATATPATVPGTPTSVGATRGDTEATVEWNPPVDAGGSAITTYTVTAQPGGATETVSAPTTTATFTGLTNGTEYTFTVVATSDAGDGLSSASATATPAGVPVAPTNISATPRVYGALVQWIAGNANGSPITGFTVTAQPGGATFAAPAGATALAVDGLSSATDYTFTVTATNDVGTSSPSAASNAITPYGERGWAPPGGTFVVRDGVLVELDSPAPDGVAVGVAPTPDGTGVWAVGADGTVYVGGTAVHYGDMGDEWLASDMVGLVPTPSGDGYYLIAADGGVFAFGDAEFRGSTASITLDEPVTGMATTCDGSGYYLIAADGGVFAFGAPFLGSMAGTPLDGPLFAIEPTCTGLGYRLIARDGGIFTFGSATFHGSLGSGARDVVVAFTGTHSGDGYWLVRDDRSVEAFGDAEGG